MSTLYIRCKKIKQFIHTIQSMVLNLGWEKTVTHKVIPLFIIQLLLTNSNSCHIFHVPYPSINILLIKLINQSKRKLIYFIGIFTIIHMCSRNKVLSFNCVKTIINRLHTYEN